MHIIGWSTSKAMIGIYPGLKGKTSFLNCKKEMYVSGTGKRVEFMNARSIQEMPANLRK